MTASFEHPVSNIPHPQQQDISRWRVWTPARLVALVTAIGFLLRIWAAWQLPIDYDEPAYLRAASDYSGMIEQRDWQGVVEYTGNQEHPPLSKLLYAGILLVTGEKQDFESALFSSRLVSVFFGTLSVLTVSLINPLAGFFLAVHTVVVKYTSEVYLEAVPSFTSLFAVYAMLRSKQAGDRWFWLSAAGLGMTAAGKFSYFPILFPVMYIAIREKRTRLDRLLFYLVLAGLVFFTLNPALWVEPVERIDSMISFHLTFSREHSVQVSGLDWYQPFIWIALPWGYLKNPQVYFYLGLDALIFLLGSVGAVLGWKTHRWATIWIVSSLLLLGLWPTRWIQYSLVVLPALCLTAAITIHRLSNWMSGHRGRLPHLSPRLIAGLGIVAAVLFAAYLGYWIWLGVQQAAWSHFKSSTGPLKSNTIYDLEPLPDGKMAVATAHGVVLWSPPPAGELVYSWQVFTIDNSELSDNVVYTLAVSPAGELWMGTSSGVDIYNLASQGWRSAAFPEPAQINDLAFDSQGNAWAATSQGAAMYNGSVWKMLTNGALPQLEGPIYSVAVQHEPGVGEAVWFGADSLIIWLLDGVLVDSYDSELTGLNPGDISDLVVDSKGRVWASSLGGGLASWDGSSWQAHQLDAPGLADGIVTSIYEYPDSYLWASIVTSSNERNILVRIGGEEVRIFRSWTSGYSGSQISSMAADGQGRLWLGTITAGLDIYRKAASE